LNDLKKEEWSLEDLKVPVEAAKEEPKAPSVMRF
jgi:hypothetical protein